MAGFFSSDACHGIICLSKHFRASPVPRRPDPARRPFPPYDGDDSTPASVLAGLDYEIVRWPWNNGSPSYTSSTHPLSNTLWDGLTGLQN